MSGLSYRHIKRHFSSAASGYDNFAVLQAEVSRRLLSRLDMMDVAPQHILDLGAGTGNALETLHARFPEAHITAIDLSYAMCQQMPSSDVICADAHHLPLGRGTVDLVFSNLTLQWTDVETVFREIKHILAPNGIFLFSTLGPDTLKELKSAWAQVDAFPHVHDFDDMHDIGDMLLRAKLLTPVMDREDITLTYRDAQGLLRDLKGIGAQNKRHDRRKGLLGKARYRAFLQALAAMRTTDRFPATYEVLFGHALQTDVPAAKRLPIKQRS